MATHSNYSYLENPMDRGAWRLQSIAIKRSCKESATTEVI